MSNDTYRRWAAGRCPCCGGDVDDWEDRAGNITDPETIAEGVRICGRCVANDHLTGGLLPVMLEAIARRDDSVIDRWVG